MASGWMLATFLGLALLRVPICAAMGVGALVGLSIMGLPLQTMIRSMLSEVRSIPLLAVPFFILAASIMNETGLTRRIFDFANALVGFMRGGLAQVNILSSLIFAGISGSALADIAGLGTIEIRAMTERGYRREFSAAITVVSSTIGPIIPPSIMFIIYAVNANVSIGQLFVAGILPGLAIAAVLMATVWVMAATGYEHCPRTERASVREIARTFGAGAPAILSPVIIVVGMVSGIATATEASVIAVLYSLLLGLFYREIRLDRLLRAFDASIRTTALIMYLTGISAVMAYVLTSEQVASAVTEALLGLSDQRWLILLLINLAILILGCMLETLPALLIAIPILQPAAAAVGIDPLQFGVILTFNLLIGIITPPVGLGLFTVCAITGLKLERVIASTAVFLPILIVALLLLSFVPALSLWRPGLRFPR
jgi:tripartite ATP-independent transporter DctM subunit